MWYIGNQFTRLQTTECWTVRGSNLDRFHRFFSPSKRTDRLWGWRCLLFSGQRGSSLGIKSPGCDVDHSHLAFKLRMSGAVPLLSLYAFMSWARTSITVSNHCCLWKRFGYQKQCVKNTYVHNIYTYIRSTYILTYIDTYVHTYKHTRAYINTYIHKHTQFTYT